MCRNGGALYKANINILTFLCVRGPMSRHKETESPPKAEMRARALQTADVVEVGTPDDEAVLFSELSGLRAAPWPAFHVYRLRNGGVCLGKTRQQISFHLTNRLFDESEMLEYPPAPGTLT
ncbi:hypothetical protein JHW43_008472 [Diplocarpon mali]|nr:hypothetical protein JHW43_008472 [Diplocarpon mali]